MWLGPDEMCVRQPDFAETLEFAQADREKFLRFGPRKRPLCRWSEEALAVTAVRNEGWMVVLNRGSADGVKE